MTCIPCIRQEILCLCTVISLFSVKLQNNNHVSNLAVNIYWKNTSEALKKRLGDQGLKLIQTIQHVMVYSRDILNKSKKCVG